MKKIGAILLVTGLLLVLVAVILLVKTPVEESISKDWKSIISSKYGSLISIEDIKGEYEIYTTGDLVSNNFYATDGSLNIYGFLVPRDNQLTKTDPFTIEYEGTVNVSYGDINASNFDEDFISKYVSEFQELYNKVYIQKKAIDSDKLAVRFKVISKANNYFEKLILYSHNNDDNYSYVMYTLDDGTFSDELIEDLISGFYKDNMKAKNTNCEKKNNEYVCAINIDYLDKSIEFKVDATKYFLNLISNYNNYQESFMSNDDNSNNGIYVTFITSSDLDKIENESWLTNYNKENVTISNNELIKYSLYKENRYMAYYIIKLEDNLSVLLNVNSIKNELDELAKDFMNYKLVNLG